jgi:hypothetical protein
MDDGTIYLVPGGGMMLSGRRTRLDCVKIFRELPYWQTVIAQSVANIQVGLELPHPESS